MSALLQDPETSLCLDRGMLDSLPGVKMLLEQSPILEPVQGGRRFIPISGNIRHYSQCSLNQRKEQDTISHVLH